MLHSQFKAFSVLVVFMADSAPGSGLIPLHIVWVTVLPAFHVSHASTAPSCQDPSSSSLPRKLTCLLLILFLPMVAVSVFRDWLIYKEKSFV